MAEILLGSGAGGRAGAVLTVTAPAGAAVAVSKDGKAYRKTSDGTAVFRGLASGWWTVEITDGSGHSAVRQVEIAVDYSLVMAFFSAFLQVTYPVGSICRCTKGNTVLTADGTSGSHTFHLPESGEWVVSCTNGTDTDSRSFNVTTDGQTFSAELAYQLYAADFDWASYGVYGTDYEIVYDDDTPVPQELWPSAKSWKARLLTSNHLIPAKDGEIDVFAVGGAAAGQSSTAGKNYYGKGGGTVCSTLCVSRGATYEIVIGAGGKGNGSNTNASGCAGGNTECFGLTAEGSKAYAGTSYSEANNAVTEFYEPEAKQYSGCQSEAGDAKANTGTGTYNGKMGNTYAAGSGIVVIRNARGSGV